VGATLTRVLLIVLLAAGVARGAALEPPEPARFDPSLLDWSKDPCTDFYAFACSRWLGANPIPGDEVAWGTSSPLNLWSKGLLRKTLEDAARPAYEDRSNCGEADGPGQRLPGVVRGPLPARSRRFPAPLVRRGAALPRSGK
jgi:hypothetical protein